MHREFTSLSSGERSKIKHLLEALSQFKAQVPSEDSPEEFVLRRVEGYNCIDGVAVIHIPTEDQKNEPWLIPVSEMEARFWGWLSPAERATNQRLREHTTNQRLREHKKKNHIY